MLFTELDPKMWYPDSYSPEYVNRYFKQTWPSGVADLLVEINDGSYKRIGTGMYYSEKHFMTLTDVFNHKDAQIPHRCLRIPTHPERILLEELPHQQHGPITLVHVSSYRRQCWKFLP